MPAKLLDGKVLAAEMIARVTTETAALLAKSSVVPGLGVMLIGDDPASATYVRNKERSALAAGLHSEMRRLPAEIDRASALASLGEMARDPMLHGVLVQLPLPAHLSAAEFQSAVPPEKDVDGLHPINAGLLMLGRDGFVPCTPRAVIALLDHAGVALDGAEAVVVGRSSIVGKPVALLLMARGATVTVCHSRTRDLAAVVRRADIVVACCGVPGLIRAEHLKPGAAVIDVGINEIRDARRAEDLLDGQPARLAKFSETGRVLVGDVHFGQAREVAGWLTPVPGGVGPMTVALLLDNTLRAAQKSTKVSV